MKLQDSPDFFGVAPNKIVGLKYANTFLIKEIIQKDGEIVEIIAEVDKKVVFKLL